MLEKTKARKHDNKKNIQAHCHDHSMDVVQLYSYEALAFQASEKIRQAFCAIFMACLVRK